MKVISALQRIKTNRNGAPSSLPQRPTTATQSNPFATSRFRLTRRRFSRQSRLPLALCLIVTLPVLILLPGFRFSSPKKVSTVIQNVEQQFLPLHHPQQHERTLVSIQHPHSQRSSHLDEYSILNTLMQRPTTSPDISAVVLFHNEYPTLNHTLHTWNNLVPHISDLVFFLNGINSSDTFRQNLPILQQPQFSQHRIIPSQENLPLGLAITEMVRQAKHENVLLLEKDWALIEDDVADVLRTSVTLLENGVHVVRLRHRQFPGAPLHARIMHDGREDSILQEQKNLFCYLHHWIRNPVQAYPQYFTTCPGLSQSDGVWCAKAQYCQWTNNPALFKKGWFLKELGERFEADYRETVKRNPTSHMLDFEFYTNWKGEVWNDRDFVIALPRGLFEHQEVSEGGVMNTVWYAWNRLQKDVDDKRKEYLERAAVSCDGRDLGTDDGLWRFQERYPVEFVRHYSYSEAMRRTMEDGVTEVRNETMFIRKRLEDGHGTWRNGVTDLTNLWYKISLFVYPSEPADMKIAFVTALYHTERTDDGGRGFYVDVAATAANLDILSNYELVVYCTAATQAALEHSLKDSCHWTEDQLKRIKFVAVELEAVLDRLLTPENMGRINKLREGQEYQARVRNRRGTTPSENALALAHTKPYLLDDAMRHVKDATHLVWFNAASPCIATSRGRRTGIGAAMGRRNDAVIRSQLFLHGFVTGVPVSTEQELETVLSGSGFDTRVFLKHVEKAPGAQLEFVDMKTFGGSRMAVSLMMGYYDVVLRNMLRDGQLGTGREAMSIARNNVEYHFRFFDGLNGCSRNMDGIHSCGRKEVSTSYMGDGALEACQLYRWVGECRPR